MTLPGVTVGSTRTTTLNVCSSPVGSTACVQLTVPVPPTAGVVHDQSLPSAWLSDTNVVPGGSVSVIAAPQADDGPASAVVIV